MPVFRGLRFHSEGDRTKFRGRHAHHRQGEAAARQSAREVGREAAANRGKVETDGRFVDPEGDAVGEGIGRGTRRGERRRG